MATKAVRLLLAAIGISAACASPGEPPAYQPWIPGSYDFKGPIQTTFLTGTIEVAASGPTSVTTSVGKCFEGSREPLQRNRSLRATFECGNHIQVILRTGSRTESALVGSVGDARTVTTIEVVGRTCVEYSEPSQSADRQCIDWEDQTRTVTKTVGGGGTLEVLAFRPVPAP